MKTVMNLLKGISFIFSAAVLFSACGGGASGPTSRSPGSGSTVTGIAYNEEGGYQVPDYITPPGAPNLVYIEGGRTVLGSFEQEMLETHDNTERTVTVASFYLDETEVANIHWLEYLFNVAKDSSEEFFQSALPDTTVWGSELAFNDPYVKYYLRHPGFRYFPIVGISWLQAADYCKWRSGVVRRNLIQLSGVELPPGAEEMPIETGLVIPDYRLPTEAEWEYAAQALIGVQWLDENQTHKRLYPWDGHALRNPFGSEMGNFLANFKRGRGDYAGIAGKLNDGAMITAWIYQYPPNDYGLYNMAGNVSEWVLDVYRTLAFEDMDDINPLRRNNTEVDYTKHLYPRRVFLDEETEYDKEGFQSLIDDHVRVFKGGSWRDVAYWMSPGTRRFLDEDSSTADIGFRCAMIRAGTNY
ncbi:MAG: gliding motility lipoprotein GldJ [Cytophagales bacterium]|nr:gliding motility lipoprotein GldJ [Cytophagales bacterium]